jgi:DeoR family transcriptional regulator, aga operon transcriptional repressor
MKRLAKTPTRASAPRSTRVELIPAERHARLLEILRVRRAASIRELAELLGGSASTVRRDLDDLAGRGAIVRTFGGAEVKDGALSTFEPDVAVAEHLEHDEKQRIGRHAALLIKPGQSVIFDSGTTVLEAARAFAHRGVGGTVVTNDVGIARLMADVAATRLVVLGGTLRPRSSTLFGEATERFVSELHVDLALIGAHSITRDLITETSLEIARIKRAIVRAARRTYVLVDHTKFREPAFADVCRAREVAGLVTSRGADAKTLALWRDAGLEIQLV